MFDFLQYPFFIRALVAGALIGWLAANLGVFVVLRRMSFFADAIAHASLTGIALGLLLGVHPILGAIVFSVLVALAIASLSRRSTVSLDTLIGVFFSTAMALGVLVIGALKGYRVDLFGYLFGDILGVSRGDIVLISLLTITTVVFLAFFFRVWTKIAFHRDLARIEGVNADSHDRLFLALLALVVALGIKLVGVVLIGPLLIIPAAAAKNISWNMRSLFVLSSAIGILSAVAGLVTSYAFDAASGPTIVLVAAGVFGISFLFRPRSMSSS